MEGGIIEKPYKPMIRLVRPMENSQGERAALLVLNYKAAGLLNQFRNIYSPYDRAMLLNKEGYWLSNHEQENEWGWLFGREDLRIQVWHPELWQHMEASAAASININGDLFSFERINIANVYEKTSHARYLDDLGLTNDVQELEWTILVQSEPSQWQALAIYKLTWFKFLIAALFIVVIALVYLLTKIKNQRRENIKLQRQQLANFRDLYENAPIGYITLSSNGLITNVNKMVLAYLGYERDELVSKRNFKDLVVEQADKPAEELLDALETARDQQTRLQLRGKNGQIIEVACNLSSRVNDEPTLEVGRCSVLDISEQAQLERRLQHLAQKDPLTGLANRRYFDEFSDHEFQRAIRQKSPLSIISLDIDHFKKVNDTHGHNIGDEVLKALALCCEKILRATDIMARFGGEEFVILLSDTNYDKAFAKAQELRLALANLPISLPEGTTLNFTASFGVATLSDELNSIDKLLKAADTTLYKAKQTGRNKVC